MRLFLLPTKLKKLLLKVYVLLPVKLRCAHTNFGPSDMLQQVRYVQSGVAELIEKQTAGWSYIRP